MRDTELNMGVGAPSRKNILSNLAWKFSERFSAQFISFIVQVVLARKLLPEYYGQIALVIIFISLANVFITTGLSAALIQKKDVDNLDFSSIFWPNLAFSVILYSIIYFSSPLISSIFQEPKLNDVLRVLAFQIPLAAFLSVQQAYVSRHLIFRCYFFSTLLGTFFSGIIGIWMAYHDYEIWAIVGQQLSNTIINSIVLIFTTKWLPTLSFSFERWCELASYGWKLLFSTLIDTAYIHLRSLLIGRFYTTSDLAFYNRGITYPQLIITNINSSISSVLFPSISRYQDDIMKVRQLTQNAISLSSYLIFPLLIGLAVIAPTLVRLMLTEKWMSCVPYLQISCFTFALMPIHTVNLEALKALGKSGLFLKLEIIKKILGVLVIAFTLPFGPLVICFGALFVSLISTLINAYPSKIFIQYSFFSQLRDILPSFLLSLCMAFLVSLLRYQIQDDFLLIISQIIIGALIYLVTSYLFKIHGFIFILGSLKKYLNIHKN